LMDLYSKYNLPKVLDFCCAKKPIRKQREKVVALSKGIVLEIGSGSGLNFPFYKTSKVKKIYALEPDKEMIELARQETKKSPIEITFLQEYAERISLKDNSVDTKLLTYPLCTIPDTMSAPKEMKRVLKSNWCLVYCEHGRAPESSIRKWQNRLNPINSYFCGGCNVNRDITRLITESGFKIRKSETMYFPGTPKLIGYNYWGTAVI
ncbi:class I SAM-dependent methyltransferase, partial [Paracoccaceae bacterium]|nr:class I SAM-dependent methyltransferase [Paracoccaceae bacterium]